jgi:hypothetical protein
VSSLGDLPNFVPDAYRLLPAEQFHPENIVIGSYTFLPWVRGGVGAVVNAPFGAVRATIDVVIPVQATGLPDLSAQTTTPIQVRGPGDVIGLDERQIIRRYPLPEAVNVEDTFLAHVEFDRPVVPWLFSPMAPDGDRLTPWISLVVLAQGRYTVKPGTGGLPDQVQTFLGELQPTDDAWAWAHAQLVGPKDGSPTVDDRLTPSYGAANLARLLCPRHLEQETQYLACIVPTFNTGKARALGQPLPGALDVAWSRADNGSDVDTAITLPVYSSWRFSTGLDGDFGSLAAKLHGVPAPWQVGRRLTEMSRPGGGIPDLAANDPGRLQTIRAAVYSPNLPDPGSQDPTEVAAVAAENAQWPASETEALRTELNRPDALAGTTAADNGPIPRPIVGPEIYDRYQASARRVATTRDADWFGELNLQPAHRVAAGLGTRVVQMDQEKLMQSAWAQVGAVDAANRALRWAQLARFVGTSSHTRHFAPLAFGDLLSATRRIQARVLTSPGLTVAADIGASSLADAAVSASFRRVTRPYGGLARSIAADPAAHRKLVADGDAARDMQRPYVELDGAGGISAALTGALDAVRVAPALGGDPTAIGVALDAANKTLQSPAATDDAADHIANTDPTPAGFAAVAAKDLMERLVRGVELARGRQPAWSVAAASLVGAMQVIPDLADSAKQLAAKIAESQKIQLPPPSQQFMGLLRLASDVDAGTIIETYRQIGSDLVGVDWLGTPDRPGIGIGHGTLVERADPAVNLTLRMKARIPLPSWVRPDWLDDQLLNPVMAAPEFTRPMYQALDEYSRDWLLPGLATFPEPDIVTLLQSNSEFVEGFLAGLSHEMGRELLWRGYPTDQRGTYFRRFWNAGKNDLAQDIAHFTPTALGTHLDATLDGVVLLVRGKLIRRYPHVMVLAMYATSVDASGVPQFEDPVANPDSLASITFHGPLPPDMVLVGFDLSVAKIKDAPGKGVGWWFVIAEHPTAPRFGLEKDTFTPTTSRDQLGWNAQSIIRLDHYLDTHTTRALSDGQEAGSPTATFGADSASTARVLLRDPRRAAFEAQKLLLPTGALHD